MKKDRVKKRQFTMALLLLLLLVLPCTAVAAETGRIEIALKDLQSAHSDRGNVEVQLYRVGDVDEHAQPSFDDVWGIEAFPQEGSKLDALAREIADKIEAPPVATAKTNAQGYAAFAQVEPGIYLVMIPKENTYGEVAPFLLNLPYYEEVDGAMEGPIYNVEVQPKASPIEPEQPEEPTKTPASETKTGDETPVWYYVTLALAAFAVITIIVIGKNKNKERHHKRGGN